MASPHVKLPASRFLSITPGAMNEIRQEADADSDLGLSASLRFAVGVASAEPVERQAAPTLSRPWSAAVFRHESKV